MPHKNSVHSGNWAEKQSAIWISWPIVICSNEQKSGLDQPVAVPAAKGEIHQIPGSKNSDERSAFQGPNYRNTAIPDNSCFGIGELFQKDWVTPE
jgi:hypothetical protein